MSACEKFDKDRVVFITKEDYDVAPKLELKVIPDENQTHGLILPNGEINFSCPCLGNMASGPCAYEFREAFSCFHNSQNEFKGSDCIDKFVAMQNCVTKYPNLYQHENAAFNQEPNMENFTATRALDSKEDKTV